MATMAVPEPVADFALVIKALGGGKGEGILEVAGRTTSGAFSNFPRSSI